MFRILKTMVLGWMFFLVVSMFFGGDRVRGAAEKAGVIVNTVVEAVADKADSVKDEAREIQQKIKVWVGSKGNTG